MGPAVALLFPAIFNLASPETACHSLRLLVTFISGDTQFPGLTLVLMVNDIPVEYYDSNITRIVSRRHWIVNETIEESHLKNFVVQKIYKSMKMQSHRLMQRFNHSRGVHVYQKFAACDLEGDSLTRFFLQDAYEGVETRNYDILTQAYSPLVPELIWTKVQMETKKLTYINVYEPLCLRTLRRYLQENKNILLRKVRPRVRVMRKTNVASGKMNVVCLATGFYPRHIKMTLLRDERAVPDEELTAGEVLPNGDGTYQLRRSLALSEEEQRKKHVYTCTVTHLSLDNRLDVRWEPESGSSPALYAGIGLLIVLFVMGITGILCWRRQPAFSGKICKSAQYYAECRYRINKTECHFSGLKKSQVNWCRLSKSM